MTNREVLTDLFALFGRTGRRRFLWLAVASGLVAVLEAASVAVVLPFIQLVLEPDAPIAGSVRGILDRMGWSSVPLVVFVGWLAVFLFLASIASAAATTWLTFRIAANENLRLSSELLTRYLEQPYPFYLGRNTATLIKNVVYEIDMLTTNLLVPLAVLVGRVMMVVSIFGFLVYSDPPVAISIVGGVCVTYVLLYRRMKRPVASLSRRRMEAIADRAQAVQEALEGVKEIKVLGREAFFIERFHRAAAEFTRVGAHHQIIGSVPKYLLEGIAIGGVLLVLVVLLQSGAGGAAVVPVLALYAAAAYRVMPAIQQIYTGATNLRYLADLVRLIRAELELPGRSAGTVAAEPRRAILQKELRLQDVTFCYSGADSPVLRSLTLSIPRNSRVGVVGTTGSGKSTLVDVMLGLLTPQSGSLLVDGVEVTPAEVRAWQDRVGYVPQTIYLSDDTIRRNVAFGVPEADIDDAAVERAAEMAGMHRFIAEEAGRGYDTVVGERGVRLSGGQRQRIGIARALYRDPEVLILDEATSSLDNTTELEVMNAVRGLTGRKTIVIVAHRLSTIRDCDQLVVLDHGRVVEHGTWDELVSRGGAFAALARTAHV
jgi:ABC-type multidrug transport system fused ATPase/permease subunit